MRVSVPFERRRVASVGTATFPEHDRRGTGWLETTGCWPDVSGRERDTGRESTTPWAVPSGCPRDRVAKTPPAARSAIATAARIAQLVSNQVLVITSCPAHLQISRLSSACQPLSRSPPVCRVGRPGRRRDPAEGSQPARFGDGVVGAAANFRRRTQASVPGDAVGTRPALCPAVREPTGQERWPFVAARRIPRRVHVVPRSCSWPQSHA